TPADNLTYWIRWYKNGLHMPGFDNSTKIPYPNTQPEDIWSCKVYAFDGIELGPPGEDEVVILEDDDGTEEGWFYLILLGLVLILLLAIAIISVIKRKKNGF
ncbi:LPXTG cell wall anchor domain-containing protein, partial [[Eubacterium] cellulosolvens]